MDEGFPHPVTMPPITNYFCHFDPHCCVTIHLTLQLVNFKHGDLSVLLCLAEAHLDVDVLCTSGKLAGLVSFKHQELNFLGSGCK